MLAGMTLPLLSTLRCAFTQTPTPESGGRLIEIRGELWTGGAGAGQLAGNVSAVSINLLDTWVAGETVESVFGLDPGLAVFYTALFEGPSEDAPLFVKLGGYSADWLLIIRRIELFPEHRGQGLGGAVIQNLVTTYAHGGLVLLEVRPLQEFADRNAVWAARMGYSDAESNLATATDKLVTYYTRQGFSELHANTDGRRILVLHSNPLP